MKNIAITSLGIVVKLIYMLGKSLPRRKCLPILASAFGLKDKAVEIGVAKGKFSEIILKWSKFSEVYSIDPWKEFSRSEYHDVNNVFQKEQDARYKQVVSRLSVYKNRSKILRMTSLEAHKLFDKHSLEFIYIDANHSYEECKRDLEMWWPKLKNGGIFAGHDYFSRKLPEGMFEVKKAVDEFVKQHQQRLFVINEEWPSWYLVKKDLKRSGLLF